jgi:uncharacterized protein (TIGR00661 family)
MAQRILIAPLDWGLGHTARCIPIIKQQLKNGNEIVFAGTKEQQEFITQHQLNLYCVDLFGYSIKYSTFLPQWIKIALQIPKILLTIKQEKKWLNELLSKEHVDLIISDNRYGLYNNKIKSIILSHQLAPESPLFKGFINYKIASFINRFNECWIPDDIELNYSGNLSNNKKIKIPIKNIGILSRLNVLNWKEDKIFDILILLSGLEPQRSILEQKLLKELKNIKLKICLVRGATKQKRFEDNITVYDQIDSDKINQLVHQSKVIICRSGYTSIMELLPLTKNIIFIPTPGQTEQEYLAKYLNQKFGIDYLEQNKLELIIEMLLKKLTPLIESKKP